MVKIFTILFLFFSLSFGAININKANSAQLQTLNGVGPTKAEEIIKYRKSHGGFKSVDELLEVKGIGVKTLDKMRREIVLN
jgi:competence protein ComEA